MLQVKNLGKKFKGSKKRTLRGISFEVADGEVYGIVGKNGAGKSTTLKCIMGIIPFEKGQVVVSGFDINKNPNEAKATIGYVPDDHAIYENLTGSEYINFMADVYRVNQEDRDRRIKKYAELLNISEHLNKQINGYSHGMRQKACIIGALVHNPKIWILDEPFLGLDPQSVNVVKKAIKTYSRSKKHIVIFTSHNIDNVIEMCDKVCIIEDGLVKDILELNTKKNQALLKKLMR